MSFFPIHKKSWIIGILAAVIFTAPAMAQSSGNPFARPAPTPPPAPAVPAPAAPTPPVPSMSKILDQNEDELRNTFSDLALVATSDSRAVIKAGETVYYLSNGDKFTYEGNEVRVKVIGDKVQLFSDKGEKSKEVFSAEVGNGIVVTRSSGTSSKIDNKPAYKPAEKPVEKPPTPPTDTKTGSGAGTAKKTGSK